MHNDNDTGDTDMDNAFAWIPFYESLADRLLAYKDRQEELFDIMDRLRQEIGQPLQYLHLEREDWWSGRRMDPFNVLGVLGRNIKERAALAKTFAEVFGVRVPPPEDFQSIPTVFNANAIFAGGPEVLWNLFCSAMEAAETGTLSVSFIQAFDEAVAAKNNGTSKVTIGLYWIRPRFFMPLDVNSRAYLPARFGLAVPGDKDKCKGQEYADFLAAFKSKVEEAAPGLTLPEIVNAAWFHNRDNPPSVQVAENAAPAHNLPKNIILYGPPGTGKTYSTAYYAVAIIEEKPVEDVRREAFEEVFRRYRKYCEEGLVAFTTFHQSFGYEEFIEGIRPVMASEEDAGTGDIRYEIRDGVFKAFCDRSALPLESEVDLGIAKDPVVWKVSLGGSGDNPVRSDCLENSYIRIGWDEYGENISDEADYSKGGKAPLNAFYNKMKIGDIVFSCYNSRTIDAIGVITGEPEWRPELEDYMRLRPVRWLVRNIKYDIVGYNNGRIMTLSTIYQLSVSPADAVRILRELNPSLFTREKKAPNRVFIIDEINRGNVSKIFGELITLIEPSKRLGAPEQQEAILPYSGRRFGVPGNVYIIGTMNTADRSIALMDTALRRRFEFIEMEPDPSTLEGIVVEGLDIAAMLRILNRRIAILLDREHALGHSYFLPLREAPTLDSLANIFRRRILPLLQEYFFDDYEKIRLVLGDNQKPAEVEDLHFIVKRSDVTQLFGDADLYPGAFYEVNPGAFLRKEAYGYLQ